MDYRNVMLLKDVAPKVKSINVMQPNNVCEDNFPSFSPLNHPSNGWRCTISTLKGFCGDRFRAFSPLCHPFNGWCRTMSTSKGRSMRSKVERRMQKESGKTLREIRRAKKLKKKLMTDEERLIYNVKRVCYLALVILM